MIRSIFGISKQLQARVDALSTMVAATSGDPKVQAALQASVETAQQTAQTAQSAASTAQQAATLALSNTATLQQTVETLNKLSADYVAAVAVSREDRVSLRAALEALTVRVTALEARKTTVALGRAATPALILGQSTDVVITLTRPMLSATYQVDVLPVAALLGKPSITIKGQTATTVTLTVKATLALAAGSVDLIAWAHG